VTRIVDNDHDRLDALGGAAGGRAQAARQLGKFQAQRRVQAIEEPSYDVASLVGCETEPIVMIECDVHSSADERSVAVCASPCVAPLESLLICVCVGVGDIVVSVHAFDPIAVSESLVRTRK
jgi:hypothetical protein